MEETMRAMLAPALDQFKRLVAAKRAWGATDEDISKMLSELETSMREIRNYERRANKRLHADLPRSVA